jgi:hypothetical protein
LKNDVWSTTDGTNWSLVNNTSGTMWKPRAQMQSLYFTTNSVPKIFVIGGNDYNASDVNASFLNDVWKSDTNIDSNST